jgi:Alkylmercury lyase
MTVAVTVVRGWLSPGLDARPGPAPPGRGRQAVPAEAGSPSRHGQRVYAWCAWDTLFLPQVLQVTARVHSVDPQNGKTLDLTVSPQRVIRRSHNDMVVSFIHPNEACREDIVANFCHQVYAFTDPDSATTWVDAHPGTFFVSLDDAFNLGQHWNRARGLS